MPAYQFIEQPDSLVEVLDGQHRLAVDTEFMREKTYFAQLCLIQIATTDSIFCVDPLTDHSARAFWPTLLDSEWVVHSARQDIEVVSQTAGVMPKKLFDTQVAAGLLGFAPQLGYANLIKELFDVDMAKSHTRADWTRRPLDEAVLQYAAEDVEYLLPAAEELSAKLDAKGRLSWAAEDSALLLDPALYDTGTEQAIDRLKGARNFRGQKRAAACRLAAWRERVAIERDRPRQWILRDNLLLDIAYQLPANQEELSDIPGLPSKLLRRSGDELLAIVVESSTDKTSYEPPPVPNQMQKDLLKSMQEVVAACAAELEIAAETIASRRELAAVAVTGKRDTRVFSGWRQQLIGDQLLKLL